ncbi:hypothetical protein [Solobacterium sp.]|uniref:hypothetical protein n=1 Tax=Solobacterium sp. TaxID=2060878 RepID=UPI0025D3D04A|nr:hypothetical protein [Solobacterium sp.]
MFVNEQFYNDVSRIRKPSFKKYFLLYVLIQIISRILKDYPALKIVFSGSIDETLLQQASHSNFLLSFIISIIVQLSTFLFLMQIYRIVQGYQIHLTDVPELLKEKGLSILFVSTVVIILDNFFTYVFSNDILQAITSIALYYLTIFVAFTIYTYPAHACIEAFKESIKESINSFKDIIKIDIHYMWVCLAALIFIIILVFPILRTIFAKSLYAPLILIGSNSTININAESMIQLSIAMFIAVTLVLILTLYRLFCAYYAHALYYFKKYVEIKPDESETLTQSTESTYEIDKNEDA